jgi:hypothetical protein
MPLIRSAPDLPCTARIAQRTARIIAPSARACQTPLARAHVYRRAARRRHRVVSLFMCPCNVLQDEFCRTFGELSFPLLHIQQIEDRALST